MDTFPCTCGSRLFFNNTVCIGCGSEVAWCEACRKIVPIVPVNGRYTCGNPKCGQAVMKCHNYAVEAVCNRVFTVDPEMHRPSSPIRSPASASAKPAASTISSRTSASRTTTTAGRTSSSPSGSCSTSSTTSASALTSPGRRRRREAAPVRLQSQHERGIGPHRPRRRPDHHQRQRGRLGRARARPQADARAAPLADRPLPPRGGPLLLDDAHRRQMRRRSATPSSATTAARLTPKRCRTITRPAPPPAGRAAM